LKPGISQILLLVKVTGFSFPGFQDVLQNAILIFNRNIHKISGLAEGKHVSVFLEKVL